MNEFTAKKLGEVLAFCNVGLETLGRGQVALESVFGKEGVLNMVNGLNNHSTGIVEISKAGGAEEITTTKATATGKKLMEMRDLYVGDQWDNPTELLEWHGFFEGAAIVHWELVCGSGIGLSDNKLQSLAQESINFHKAILDRVSEALRATGSTRAAK